MDDILAKALSQAMTFAIRSGITFASGFAIKTVAKLLDRLPPTEKQRIENAQRLLQIKTGIVCNAIDLVKLEAARGNSSLENTLELVENLKQDIDLFDERINTIIQGMTQRNDSESAAKAEAHIGALLKQMSDVVPLISLSLLTSGVSMANSLDPKVSPSRLLEASNSLCRANTKFKGKDIDVKPVFTFTLYTVFYKAHAEREEPSVASLVWKEDYALALCKVVRRGTADFRFDLVIKEDFDDGRYHEDETPRERIIPISSVLRQFYSASGRLLRLETSDLPVLVFKVKTTLTFEYLALGVGDGKGSLSLLQYIVRLAAAQEAEQTDLLHISDEKLTLYINDSAEAPAAKRHKVNDTSQLDNESNTQRLHNLTLTK